MRNKKSVLKLALVILALLGISLISIGLFSNENESNQTSISEPESASVIEGVLPLNLEFNNLLPLDNGKYEVWLVRGDVSNSIGKFSATVGKAIKGDLSLADNDPQNGDTVMITIEPTPDNDLGPSATVILSGEIIDGFASLTFPIDISGFSGQYILGTPTDDPEANETAGVWFTATGTAPTLRIPDAPEGWAYEGWAIYEDKPISTGQFVSASGTDEFNGYSGTVPGPNYPGEDFIRNLPYGLSGPLDLANGTTKIVISLEPRIDGVDPTGPGLAQIRPLIDVVPIDAVDHSRLDFSLVIDTPTGSASL